MPDTEPRNETSSVLSTLKHGSNGMPFSEAHTAVEPTRIVLTGRCASRTGPCPPNWMVPATEPSLMIRPLPRLPSKQVNAKNLPAMNWRASSGESWPAAAGPIAAQKPSATSKLRDSMRLNSDSEDRQRLLTDCLNAVLTIPTKATL